ncbi:transmembrane sensor [Caulobacter rhizosphaerae]|uniref:Transmembrane sensor n=1 Tax=Caulobacter rhizosphaerae TaxID=2010972 RepID=A0ABU1MX18_9CAUL|nr:FecR domain-containing protein [Caulobacter rhizosphaerae]MDR6530266.1 transmembrane sensor [Caulobacter rhizosphaerae]
MSLSTVPTDQARREATEWFARLNKLDVPLAEMQAWKAWLDAPGNKAAYDEVDAFWRRSEGLKDDPDIKAAVANALGRATASAPTAPPRRRGFAVALAVGVVAAIAGGYALWAPKVYSTGVGEQRTIQLADGSTVVLDTDSQVAVRLTGAQRDIRLGRGQALFDVAHDGRRPFVVTAGAASIKALGTRFDVRREARGAIVTLVRGAVEVRQGGAAEPPQVWRLAPGQRVATQVPAPRPSPVDVDTATSWASGRLVFRAVPLRAAVAEFNRYERHKIEVADGPVGDELISGVFAVGDSDTFVGSMADLHDLTIERSDKDGTIRLTREGDGGGVR